MVSYIYGLSSSKSPEMIRYIGVSINPIRRLNEHIRDSEKKYCHRQKWINSVLESGNEILTTILDEANINDIYNKEKEYIKLFKSIGADLVNSNEGGLGGISPNKETRNKISIGNKGKIKTTKQLESIKNLHLGKPFPNTWQRIVKDDDIIKMFKLYKTKSVREISKILNINLKTISNIIHTEKYYKDVKLKYNLRKEKVIHSKNDSNK